MDLTTRYQMPATRSSGICLKLTAWISCAEYRPSGVAMTLTSAEVFSMEIVSLPVGGVMTRIACGSTMRRIVCSRVMPSDCAASVWPSSTEMMPAHDLGHVGALVEPQREDGGDER